MRRPAGHGGGVEAAASWYDTSSDPGKSLRGVPYGASVSYAGGSRRVDELVSSGGPNRVWDVSTSPEKDRCGTRTCLQALSQNVGPTFPTTCGRCQTSG
jgi:hypothetical protein